MTAWTDTSSAAVGSSSTSRTRIGGDGAGDAHARLLAAGKLMGEAVEQVHRQAGAVGGVAHAGHEGGAIAQALQAAQRMGDAVEGAVSRIEAVVRILEHDLDVAALWRPVELRAGMRAINSPSKTMSPSSGSSSGRPARQGALARARFAHQAQRAARRQAERDVVDGRRRTANDFTTALQLQQGRRAGLRSIGLGTTSGASSARSARVEFDASARRRPDAACQGWAGASNSRSVAPARPPARPP